MKPIAAGGVFHLESCRIPKAARRESREFRVVVAEMHESVTSLQVDEVCSVTTGSVLANNMTRKGFLHFHVIICSSCSPRIVFKR